MWLVASYQPVALFTLKVGTATATGGKTLLVPTPFAIRTALLDVAIRLGGERNGRAAFDLLRTLDIAVAPPAYAVVTNLFARILKPTRGDKESDEAMTRTIAFREYVHYTGTLSLAFGGEEGALRPLAGWLAHLTYLGRRGGFFQFLPPPAWHEPPGYPDGFTRLTQAAGESFPLGVLQLLDDWGPSLTYEKVNVFAGEAIRRPGSGEDRLRYSVVLPYRFRRAGRGFTLYERFNP